MKRSNRKAFTILELLVVVAIIAILAAIAIPNFIGRIEESKDSRELAEINAVDKAISMYYADNGVYPTLQGKDGTLLQPQPIEGSPHNIDFSSLVPTYLATLPHFSYWWVDYQGNVFHTDKSLGSLLGSAFTPTTGYTYTLYKTNGTTQVLSGPYTLLAGEYIVGKEENGMTLPKISAVFKNEKMHPEDPAYVAAPTLPANTLFTFTTAGASGINGPTQAQVNTTYLGTPLETKVSVTTQGIQEWLVPVTGTYTVEAWGAKGGGGIYGGLGAKIKGTVQLFKDTKLLVIVGQLGGTSPSSYVIAGNGGGGGTFVLKSTGEAVIVAGGGGGATITNTAQNANIGTDGKAPYLSYTSTGYASNGDNGAGFDYGIQGNGVGFNNILSTNALGRSGNAGGSGGFGGGGGGRDKWYSGSYFTNQGAGGGYSGGSASVTYSNTAANPACIAGGGGGSFNSGTSQSSSVDSTGDGKVMITYVGP